MELNIKRVEHETLLFKNGFSIVSSLASIAILSIVMVSMASMFNMQQKLIAYNQTLFTRNMLIIQLQQAIINPKSWKRTKEDNLDAGNVWLTKCLEPNGNSCTQTSSSHGFIFYDGIGNKLSGSGPASPLYYSYSGEPCSAPSSTCLFSVYTLFMAKCSFGTTCSNPNVSISFSINQIDGIHPIGGKSIGDYSSSYIPVTVNKPLVSCNGPQTYGGGYITDCSTSYEIDNSASGGATQACLSCGVSGPSVPAPDTLNIRTYLHYVGFLRGYQGPIPVSVPFIGDMPVGTSGLLNEFIEEVNCDPNNCSIKGSSRYSDGSIYQRYNSIIPRPQEL